MSEPPPSEDLYDEPGDEEVDQWLAEFEAADRHAAGVLREALGPQRGAPAPSAELAAAAGGVRAGLGSRHPPFDWIANAAGFEGAPPTDDQELLLSCTAGTISPREDTGLDPEEESMLMSLQHEEFVETTFALVTPAWNALGLIDREERLTPLGAWALPRALARAWGADFDAQG